MDAKSTVLLDKLLKKGVTSYIEETLGVELDSMEDLEKLSTDSQKMRELKRCIEEDLDPATDNVDTVGADKIIDHISNFLSTVETLDRNHQYRGKDSDNRHVCECGRRFLFRKNYEKHSGTKTDSNRTRSNTLEQDSTEFGQGVWLQCGEGFQGYVELGTEVEDVEVMLDLKNNEVVVTGDVHLRLDSPERLSSSDTEMEWSVSNTGYLTMVIQNRQPSLPG
ncbi:MAG: hypothetical protein ABEK59_04300 [Halobacteria archaeon]